jgi:hypothetical protein
MALPPGRKRLINFCPGSVRLLAVIPQTFIHILNAGSPIPEKLLFLPFHLIKNGAQHSAPGLCWRQCFRRSSLLFLWSRLLTFLFIFGLFHLPVEELTLLIIFF